MLWAMAKIMCGPDVLSAAHVKEKVFAFGLLLG